ncbi:MAG: YbhB/YbcL family Raf kinase inhibitor-like protein [Treponemataceae bacterium]
MKKIVFALFLSGFIFFVNYETAAQSGNKPLLIASDGIVKGVIKAQYGQFGDVANIEEKNPGVDSNGKKVIMKVNKLSFPLSIKKYPKQTKAFVLYMYDPDAAEHGFGPFVHWTAYFTGDQLSENASRVPPMGMVQGMNGWGYTGYAGMGPPDKLGFTEITGGPVFKGSHEYHRYVIEVFALSEELSLKDGFSVEEMKAAIKDKVLSKGQLTAKYFTDVNNYK